MLNDASMWDGFFVIMSSCKVTSILFPSGLVESLDLPSTE